MSESRSFNSLDIVTHNDRHEKLTPEECPHLDDRYAAIDNQMSHILGNNLTI
eukprot:CAMPEP_0194087004 /NCGR_PEP_ID=MMETSP0149-20130528/23405_1 /TAXON_ID=122233 /ORGANISM="Chaetoceros debilis, Strain MM31A-1" /LENGTH=51 /DNA_ID=CAMNT_0038770245 /DNA_START=30 /DNA_END=182 /DNA_ORIENTATION=-